MRLVSSGDSQENIAADRGQTEEGAAKKGTNKYIPFGAALAVGLLIQLIWGLDVGG
jgi:prepilin signal peptidase PulO-like enzyme (type II secretory pathway)